MKRFILVLIEFFRLKFEETRYFWIVVGGLLCLIFVPWQVGRWANILKLSWMGVGTEYTWITGALFLLTIAILGAGILILILEGVFIKLVNWIKDNWRMANENVDKKLGGSK